MRPIELGQHLLHSLKTGADRGLGPTRFLNAYPRRRLVPGQATTLLQHGLDERHVGLLTTEVEEHDAADIRVVRVVRERAEQHRDVGAIGTTTSLVVRNRYDAIHVRKSLAIEQRVLGDDRDLGRLVARTHARRHDQQEVAGADTTIRAAKARECRAFRLGDVIRCLVVKVGWQIPHERHGVVHVVGRDRRTPSDAARRAYGLAVLQDGLPLGNIAERDAMASVDVGGHGQIRFVRHLQLIARTEAELHDRDVVRRKDDDHVLG